MRVILLGGTSFIGPSVVRRLAEQGHRVAVFNRGRTLAKLPSGVERIIGERERIDEALPAIKAFGPDVAIDMFAMTEEDARLAHGALTGVVGRTVAVSSIDVYRAYDRMRKAHPGRPDEVPLTEDSPLREHLYPYRGDLRPEGLDEPWLDDYDKILVERVAMGDSDLQGSVVRLPMVYGERDGQHRFRRYLDRMDAGDAEIVLNQRVATWRTTWGFVDNIGDAIALVATDDRAAAGVYNVGEENPPTMIELIGEISAVVGWIGEIVTVPDEELDPGFEPDQDLVASTERIRGELGYEERVSRKEALCRTVDWEREVAIR